MCVLPARGWSGQTADDVRQSFEAGKQHAAAILDAALLELELSGGGESQTKSGEVEHSDPSTVFVVYGRDTKARESLYAFLRSVGLHPLDWLEVKAATGRTMPYTLDIVRQGFSMARAAVVLFTPDDDACLREPLRREREPQHEIEATPQPRQNVLFEAGMAIALHPDRTVIVELGERRPFSDIEGYHTVRLTNAWDKRQELAMVLQTAKCKVNLDGSDWHKVGDFDSAWAAQNGQGKATQDSASPEEPADERRHRDAKAERLRHLYAPLIEYVRTLEQVVTEKSWLAAGATLNDRDASTER